MPAIAAACHTSGLVPVGRAEESGPQGLDHANAEGRMAREVAQKIGNNTKRGTNDGQCDSLPVSVWI